MLSTDDDARHEYIWHGPQGSILGFELHFKGRALSEWAIAITLFIVLWRPMDWLAIVLGVHSMIVSVFVHIFGGWFAAGWLATRMYRQFVDKDRNLPYLARVVAVEAARVWRSRGPRDPVVAVVSIPVWLLFTRLGGLVLHGPFRPALLAVSVLAGWLVARWLVARFEPAERRWTRRRRAARLKPLSSQGTETVEVV